MESLGIARLFHGKVRTKREGFNGTNNTVNPKSKARKIFKIALIGTSDRKKSFFRVFVPVSVGDVFLKNKNVKNRDFLHKKNREKNETFRKIKREKR